MEDKILFPEIASVTSNQSQPIKLSKAKIRHLKKRAKARRDNSYPWRGIEVSLPSNSPLQKVVLPSDVPPSTTVCHVPPWSTTPLNILVTSPSQVDVALPFDAPPPFKDDVVLPSDAPPPSQDDVVLPPDAPPPSEDDVVLPSDVPPLKDGVVVSKDPPLYFSPASAEGVYFLCDGEHHIFETTPLVMEMPVSVSTGRKRTLSSFSGHRYNFKPQIR